MWDWGELITVFLAVFFLVLFGVLAAFGIGWLAIELLFEVFFSLVAPA